MYGVIILLNQARMYKIWETWSCSEHLVLMNSECSSGTEYLWFREKQFWETTCLVYACTIQNEVSFFKNRISDKELMTKYWYVVIGFISWGGIQLGY